MKNIKKHVLSLIMVATMICSVPMTSFATESQTTEYWTVLEEADAGSDVSITSVNDLKAVTDVITVEKTSAGQVVTGTFFAAVQSGKYVTIVIRGQTNCTVTVTDRNGVSHDKYIPAPGNYTICTGSGSSYRFQVRYHMDGGASAFQFFQTDYSHN